MGLKEGASSFTFKDDNTITAVVGKRTLSGTYTYDSATHAYYGVLVAAQVGQGSMATPILMASRWISFLTARV